METAEGVLVQVAVAQAVDSELARGIVGALISGCLGSQAESLRRRQSLEGRALSRPHRFSGNTKSHPFEERFVGAAPHSVALHLRENETAFLEGEPAASRERRDRRRSCARRQGSVTHE